MKAFHRLFLAAVLGFASFDAHCQQFARMAGIQYAAPTLSSYDVISEASGSQASVSALFVSKTNGVNSVAIEQAAKPALQVRNFEDYIGKVEKATMWDRMDFDTIIVSHNTAEDYFFYRWKTDVKSGWTFGPYIKSRYGISSGGTGEDWMGVGFAFSRPISSLRDIFSFRR